MGGHTAALASSSGAYLPSSATARGGTWGAAAKDVAGACRKGLAEAAHGDGGDAADGAAVMMFAAVSGSAEARNFAALLDSASLLDSAAVLGIASEFGFSAALAALVADFAGLKSPAGR